MSGEIEMNLPFEFLALRNGNKGELRILEETDRNALDQLCKEIQLQDEEYHLVDCLQSKFSMGVFCENALIATVLCRNADHEDETHLVKNLEKNALADIVWVERIIAQSEISDQKLLTTLLMALISYIEQSQVKYILSRQSDERARNVFLQAGFERIDRALINDASMLNCLQRGLGSYYSPRALLVIDYTFDFVADDGKLTCGVPGQNIARPISNYIEWALQSGDYLFVFRDLHTIDDFTHPETALFPAHNLEGSEGRYLFGSVEQAVKLFEQVAPERLFCYDKTRYSCFVKTPLEEDLQRLQCSSVILTGVCTDICVLHTAMDAYNRGISLMVATDGVASFDQNAHEVALKHMKNCLGADLICWNET